MNIMVYVNKKFEHQIQWLGAFIDGLSKSGNEVRTMGKDIPAECDLAVMWSHGPTWANVIAHRKAKGKNYLVLDRGYVGGQENSASISLNGIHGLSAISSHVQSDERSEKYQDLVKPWKPGKKYVLLVGQVAGDASLQGLNIHGWLKNKSQELLKAGFTTVYRPHPRQANFKSIGIPFMTTDLDYCLKHAICAYTYSSTVGVDAMLAGKPVIAESPVSMVYDLAGHEISDIKKIKKVPKDRGQWLNDIAFRQWSLDEIRSGEAWEYSKYFCDPEYIDLKNEADHNNATHGRGK